jgi:hypothetical protein
MKKISTLLFFTFCFFTCPFSANAQNFLWGRSGGSSDPTQGPDDETVRDMAVDKNGNVYVLTIAQSTNRNVAGHPLSSFGNSDIVLASFKPDGNFRWAKVVGSSSIDDAFNLAIDNNGGVYFTGSVLNNDNPGHVDADATLAKTNQRQILVKYDTSGNFKWYRQPEDPALPDANNWVNTQTMSMDVDNVGNVYWLMWLYPGVYGGSLTVPSQGVYVLKYDAAGNFSYFKPDMDCSSYDYLGKYLTLDESNSQMYITGYKDNRGTLMMGGSTITNSMIIGCFNLNGVFQWKRENILTIGGFNGRPVIDNSGNIYLAGIAYGEFTGVPPHPADNFNGYTVTHSAGHSMPFIVKMDKAGNNIWAADAEVNAASSASAIALRNNNEVIIVGDFPGSLQWPGFGGTGINSPVNYGYDMFITRFDASNGAVLGMDRTSSSSGNNEFPTCIVADGNNNVYIGGRFDADMNVALDNLANPGGRSDWFLIKYGNMWPDNVNSFINDKDVLLYPNPAQNTINIDKVGAGTTLQLTDMTGRNLLTKQLQADHESMDVSQYPSGSYIIQLADKNGGRLTKKFVKG